MWPSPIDADAPNVIELTDMEVTPIEIIPEFIFTFLLPV